MKSQKGAMQDGRPADMRPVKSSKIAAAIVGAGYPPRVEAYVFISGHEAACVIMDRELRDHTKIPLTLEAAQELKKNGWFGVCEYGSRAFLYLNDRGRCEVDKMLEPRLKAIAA